MPRRNAVGLLLRSVAMVQGGDLRRALSDDRTGNLLWYNKGKQILMDVARGLTFCHEQRNGPIAHR
jgi:hypothetical protein